MPLAYLSIGGNQGDVAAAFQKAVVLLNATPGCKVRAVSSNLRTKPWGDVAQPDFLNAALIVETTQTPHELLKTLQGIEIALGRTRDPLRPWGPRTFDADIVFYDDLALATPDLKIPHPRLEEHYHALKPLAEIAPDKKHPVTGKTVRVMLAKLPDPDFSV